MDHIDDDGLVFFVDAVDRIDKEYGSTGSPDLYEKFL